MQEQEIAGRCEGGEKCWHGQSIAEIERMKGVLGEVLAGGDGFAFVEKVGEPGFVFTHNVTGGDALAYLLATMKVGFWDVVRIWRRSVDLRRHGTQ